MTDELWTRPGLLDAFREGEAAVLTAVYKNYVSRIAAWLRDGFPAGSDGGGVPGIKNEADHADAVQETIRRAFEAKARLAYDGKRDYWSYLSTVARYVAVDHFRRRRRVVPVPGRDSSDPPTCWLRPSRRSPPKARAIVREYVAGLPEPLRFPGDNLKRGPSGNTMKPRTRSKPALAVGALVKFKFGGHDVQATVIEDRGPVGANGRRILRVRLELAGTDPIEFEVPAEDVQLAA